MRFPYQNYPVPGIGRPNAIVRRPKVWIRAIGPIGDFSFYGLVDTGADDILLPDRFGQAMGVVIQPNMHAPVGGIIGAGMVARFGMIDLELRRGGTVYRWSALAGFHPGNAAILGTLGMLEHFRASFNHSLGHFHLIPTGNLPAPVMNVP